MSNLAIGVLRVDGGTQSRAAIDGVIVAEYAEQIANGAVFPPVDVFFDGRDYWVADGFHRRAAFAKAGATIVSATVHQGTQRDALLFSVGANRAHGLRRTNADKRRSVEALLRDSEWVMWSDEQIANACGTGRDFVRRTRAEMFPTCISDPGCEDSEPKRLGRDGKWRRMPRGGKGRSRPLTDNEEAILSGHNGSGVYAIRKGDLFKIGWSRDPHSRVQSLLTQFQDSTLIAVRDGSSADERRIHKALEGDREHSEWFKSSLQTVLAALFQPDDEPEDYDPGPEVPDEESDIADADAPVVAVESEHPRRWGDFELSGAVADCLKDVQSFREKLAAAFEHVDPVRREEFAKRIEPALLAMFVDVRSRLPATARRVEENRAHMRVVDGGK